MSVRGYILSICILAACLPPLSAQNTEQTDSVVVLMNAKSLQMVTDEFGFEVRKAFEARFLHNNTYLVCDTAYWNVNTKTINAFGNVQILQDRTVLSSDKLDYLIEEDLAQFRGPLVQLMDKDGNTLRTRYLDYNTKDSVAIFRNGASMRDKDGQVIESSDGTYDSKERLFTFQRNVNMYTDSVYVKTSRLDFHSDYDFAEFFDEMNAWKDDNMISSHRGTYDRANERFFFTGNVHIMSDTQEGWSDSLYFDRLSNDVEMYGHVQVTDTTRNVSAMADKLLYADSLSRVNLDRNATVVARTEENGQVDTVYIGADSFVYWTVPRCDIAGGIVSTAQQRLTDMASDPVTTYRRKAAEAAAKAAAEAANADDPNRPKQKLEGQTPAAPPAEEIAANASEVDIDKLKIKSEASAPIAERAPASAPDSLSTAPQDSVSLNDSDPERNRLDSLSTIEKAREDSLTNLAALEQARLDSLASRDTTAIGFMRAKGKVRMFRKDMQMLCDSLEYSDLDSLARLFVEPLVWNEGNRQYSSDSLYLVIKNQRMDKASLLSNAFIIIQEDTICYDQIKGAEIMAYFDSTTALTRFDALGGAQAMFYLEENEAFATVNKVESKMLSATFVDANIDRVYYFDNPKNNAYPIVQLPEDERKMKGFSWQPDLRPKGKEDITPLVLRPSQRLTYLARPMPKFTETERFFPGYMASVKKKLASRDSLRSVRHAEELQRKRLAEDEAEMAAIMAALDSADRASEARELPDSLSVGTPSVADSVTVQAPEPEEAPADTGVVTEDVVPTDAEIKAMARQIREAEREKQKSEAEAKRQARVEAKEARWAELDARDAEKAAAKEAKALEKKRKRTYEAVLDAEKDAARDKKKLDRYIRRFEKAKVRKELRNKNQ